MLQKYFDMLSIKARGLDYRVTIASKNKACHHPHYVIFIKKSTSIENIYSFAHEIGHCIDFRNRKLDFQRYRVDKKYRIWKEIIAWYLGFKLCLELKIPITYKFFKHSIHCLRSYIK